ncbi:RNA polymerase sigma-70 factor (ECF subfamily) [Alteromonadaceae bacterium 2753L.S.0a.02]|nr:RNA polymerase sigma-70 factor (ECF subfamily) [Alteromonadaceae bacterium 2753L.S.0a.02]
MVATRQILQQEVQRLRRFAYSLTTNVADADDLVHDVVIKVLEKGLPENENPVPWLLTLTKNLWVDRLRHREVTMRPENEALAPIPAPEAEPLTALQTQRVLSGLQSLPTNLRLALSLVAVEGLSYKEAAKVLQIPIGTVMSRVARAREHMLSKYTPEVI